MKKKHKKKKQIFYRGHQCILYKLLDALAASRFTFDWEEQLSGIVIWLLFVVFFHEGKD
jgi:hypothetical protein